MPGWLLLPSAGDGFSRGRILQRGRALRSFCSIVMHSRVVLKRFATRRNYTASTFDILAVTVDQVDDDRDKY